MGDTWDKVKNKSAEMKGEMKNEFKNLKNDIKGEDYAGEQAYRRGEKQAMAGVRGAAERYDNNSVTEDIVDRSGITRNLDGTVNTDAAELRGEVKNQIKHENKEEKKGFNDTLNNMKD